jgi:hypothetical protein
MLYCMQSFKEPAFFHHAALHPLGILGSSTEFSASSYQAKKEYVED